MDALREVDPHAAGSQVDWPERWAVPEDGCWVVLVQLRWVVRSEVDQGGYLVVLADWVDLQADCSVVPVERRWAVRAELTAAWDVHQVVAVDWAGWCGSPVGLMELPAAQEEPREHLVFQPAGSQPAADAPQSVQWACRHCSGSLAVDE